MIRIAIPSQRTAFLKLALDKRRELMTGVDDFDRPLLDRVASLDRWINRLIDNETRH